jgi:hemolysin D
MKSSSNVVPLTREPVRRDRDELAFLPAALEIVETPPSPLGRVTAAVVAALFCLALAWACVGRIDIVASAQGRIIPSGRSKVVQPFETGVVRAIHVHDGQSVKAGEVLIELDPTMNQAERDRLQKDLIAARLDAARLRAALAEGSDPIEDFRPPDGASADMIAVHRRLLIEQVNEHRAKLAVLDKQESQKSAERATVASSIEKLDALMPTIQERFDIRKDQFDRQVGSKIAYLENLQQLVDAQHERVVQQSRYRETEAALAALGESRAQTRAEFRRGLAGELAEAERKVAGLTEDVIKADQRTSLQQLKAPEDGVVQQLAVHTVGGVVTPAQSLLVVVPADSRLEVEAMISNRDIGFVHAGEEVEIKVDTFNFTRYGLLHGRVLNVSRDAITRDRNQSKTNDAGSSDASASEPDGQLVYAARISLDQTRMQVENAWVDLAPGMAVTAEIKSGSRTIISYLLSPVLKYGHDSMRER